MTLLLLANSQVSLNNKIYKARHILYKPYMIDEIIAGRKKETRRIIDADGKNRYGEPDDLLYIKETYNKLNGITIYKRDMTPEQEKDRQIYLDRGHTEYRWCSALFMPRRVARYWLIIKNIKKKFLHEITEKDAHREGFKNKEDFIRGWNEINPGVQFINNPLVWVIKFKLFHIGRGVEIKY